MSSAIGFNLDQSKIMSSGNWLNDIFCLRQGRKHPGKRIKCWLPAFFPFPTMFSRRQILDSPKLKESADDNCKL